MSFKASGLQPGLAIDPVSGIIAGTLAAPGGYSSSVSVPDNGGLQASVSFSWSVADVVPQVTASSVAPRLTGDAVIYAPAVANAADDTNGWTFGDGTKATPPDANATASHVFASAGICTVALVMKNTSGNRFPYSFDQAVHVASAAGGSGANSSGLAVETRKGASSRLYLISRQGKLVYVTEEMPSPKSLIGLIEETRRAG